MSNRLHQRGWTLVEAAIVVALLGLIALTLMTAVRSTGSALQSQSGAQQVDAAVATLFGQARADYHLPSPDQSAEVREGYLEGTLNNGFFSFGSDKGLRYIVDRTLVTVPAVRYRPDPIPLLTGVDTRTKPNGLDLCLAIVQRETARHTLPGSRHQLALAVQQVTYAGGGGSPPPGIWLGDSASPALPPGTVLNTRTFSYGELAQMLGCFDRWGQIAAQVKSAAATGDLALLAEQERAFREWQVTRGETDLMSLEWRMAVRSSQLLVVLAQTRLTISQLSMDKAAATAIAATNLVALTLAASGLAMDLTTGLMSLNKAKAGVVAARQTADIATRYAREMNTFFGREVQKVNQLQERGLEP